MCNHVHGLKGISLGPVSPQCVRGPSAVVTLCHQVRRGRVLALPSPTPAHGAGRWHWAWGPCLSCASGRSYQSSQAEAPPHANVASHGAYATLATVSATWTTFLHPLSSSTHRSTLVGWEETSRTEQTHQEAFVGATRPCLRSSWEMKASLRMQVGSSVVWATGTMHCDLPPCSPRKTQSEQREYCSTAPACSSELIVVPATRQQPHCCANTTPVPALKCHHWHRTLSAWHMPYAQEVLAS